MKHKSTTGFFIIFIIFLIPVIVVFGWGIYQASKYPEFAHPWATN